jgi:hypothetical protein
MGVQFGKNGLFFMGCTYEIYGNNVHYDCDMISVHCSLITCGDKTAVTSALFPHIAAVGGPQNWLYLEILISIGSEHSYPLFPPSVPVWWPNIAKLFCITSASK